MKKLTLEDKEAVDILLDRCAAANAAGKPSYAAGNGTGAARVQSLRRLLELLDLHAACEPPVDLVAKTLARIDSEHHGLAWHKPEGFGGHAGKPA